MCWKNELNRNEWKKNTRLFSATETKKSSWRENDRCFSLYEFVVFAKIPTMNTVCFCAYRSTFAQYWTHNFPLGTRKSRLWNFTRTNNQPTELWFGMSNGKQEWRMGQQACIYTSTAHTHHRTLHTHTTTAKARASTSKMILKSMWSLYKEPKYLHQQECQWRRTRARGRAGARSISSHTVCYCCVSTERGTDTDDRGKLWIVCEQRACNKVNRMEHVFANAICWCWCWCCSFSSILSASHSLPHSISLLNTNTYTRAYYTRRFSISSMIRALFA